MTPMTSGENALYRCKYFNFINSTVMFSTLFVVGVKSLVKDGNLFIIFFFVRFLIGKDAKREDQRPRRETNQFGTFLTAFNIQEHKLFVQNWYVHGSR